MKRYAWVLLPCVLAATVMACDRDEVRPASRGGRLETPPALVLEGDPEVDCVRVAERGAAVIVRHFETLASRLPAPDRTAWMASLDDRFSADRLAARCEARRRDDDFALALGCAAGAVTMQQIQACRLWVAGPSCGAPERS